MYSKDKFLKKSNRYYPLVDPKDSSKDFEGSTRGGEERSLSTHQGGNKKSETDLLSSESANSVNSVYANISMFEELNKESSRSPSLIKISKANIDPNSKTFTNVSYFERIEASARKVPDLDGGNKVMKLEESKIHTTVSNFEDLVQFKTTKPMELSSEVSSTEKISSQLHIEAPEKYVSLNKSNFV